MTPIGVAIFVTSLVFGIFATLAVAGRIYCRNIKNAPFKADDWLIVAAWVLTIALSITIEWGTIHAGVGYVEQQLSQTIVVRFLKIQYITEIVITVAAGLIKLSVFAFYRRIFDTQRSFVLVVNILIAITAAWTIAVSLSFMFDLVPIKLQWGLEVDRPDRLSIRALILFYCVSGLFLDLLIVALPIPMLRSLHTSKRRRVKFYCFFLLWIFCCATAAIKVAFAVKWWQYSNVAPDAKINISISITMWLLIECLVGITAACLLTLGPLFKEGQGFHRLLKKASLFSLRKSNQQAATEKSKPHFGWAIRHEEVANSASAESRKWRGVWRAIAGGNNFTSVGSGSNKSRSQSPRGGMGISVHQRFGTEVHDAGAAASTASSEAGSQEAIYRQV